MNLRGESVLVIGTKRSGLGAAEFLLQQGAAVRAMDTEKLGPEDQAKFDALGVRVDLQAEQNLGNEKLIILSPAVPWDLPMLVAARARGVRVIGEMELASHFLQGPIIGITGSNGKTTTTALVGHLLNECGISVQVGGNIGRAATSLIGSSKPNRWNVFELSSFQLESIKHFHPKIAACLNVTPDHLDRHRTFAKYAAAKGRLFETQTADDFAVLNQDDSTSRSYAGATRADVRWFSSLYRVSSGMWLDGDRVLFNGQPFIKRSQIPLRGLHNVENVMAASLIAHLVGAKSHDIAAAVETFPGVEHRIEFVRKLDGVEYYNDSKATNVDAALKAIEAFPGPLWLIMGGKHKGSRYTPLRAPLQDKARGVLLIGAGPPYPHAAAPLIRRDLDRVAPLIDCSTLESAVLYAREHAESGDVVLLAPACASFDQFESYEHRGARFKQLVAELL